MEFDATLPVKSWDEEITKHFKDYAGCLLNDLEEHQHKVGLIDAPQKNHDSHKIRILESSNPKWYRDIWHSYQHMRRYRAVKALTRINEATDKQSTRSRCHNAEIFRNLIFSMLTEGYVDELYGDVPPLNLARTYFGLPPAEMSLESELLKPLPEPAHDMMLDTFEHLVDTRYGYDWWESF